MSKDKTEQAKTILKWVQDNMALSGEKHDYFNDITITEKASESQIAVLCHKMFQKAGLKSRLIITGNKGILPIDTSFLFYDFNYLTNPLPVLEINNNKYVAFPFSKGYELGEYPLKYNNTMCLNLKNKHIEGIPAPKWGTEWERNRMVLDISSFPGKYKIFFEYKENSASSYRDTLLGLNKGDLEGEFKDWIQEYTESNKLQSFEIKNLNEYDKPLQVIVHFKNDDTPIPYGNKKIFQLKSFFIDHFEDITADRTEDVFIHDPTTYVDEIEVLKIPGKKIEFDIKMEKPIATSEPEVIHYIPSENKASGLKYDKISSKLFTVDYHKSETDSSFIFKRILELKPIQVGKKDMKKVYNECVKLNSIKNSSVIIE
jgi:hypothetical protein